MTEPLFFTEPAQWRAWLAAHHADETEVRVGFYKRATRRPTMTWAQAVREALCFGWIDGVRHRIDDQSHEIRFTPRKRASNWSAVNIKLATELIANGEMQPAGLAAFEARTEKRSRVYAYEQDEHGLSAGYDTRLRADSAAAAFFDAQAPWYRRTAAHWVMSAKREETRERRLATLIEDSRNERRIGPLNRPS